MTRWGMVVDLRRCFGCHTCAIVCMQVNGTIRNGWRRVMSYGPTEPPDRERTFLPLSCMNCADAPCLAVCPTGATFQRGDGIVGIHYDLCVGCGYCILACPYEARVIVQRRDTDRGHGLGHVSADLGSGLPREEYVGVCTKCHFCSPRIDAGLAIGLQPGKDAEATPACVLTCTGGALHFGDLDDPESDVATMIGSHGAVVLQEELRTGPAVYFIMA